MEITKTAAKAAMELSATLEKIDEAQVQALVDAVMSAQKIYFAGAGRSLLALRCVAMRFMHVNFEVYIVGDTTTPAFTDKDLLIVGSGSGETAGMINVASKAKKLGGKVALFTIREQSTLASLADLTVRIPAYTDKVEDPTMVKPILPGGTMFEQSMLVLGDTMILELGKRQGVSTETYFVRHANLE